MTKTYKDTDLLLELYEDKGLTYAEIADELDCGVATISRHMPDDAHRGGGESFEHIAMFSGGHDSLVSTHYVMEQLDGGIGDCVLHIDTGTGIEENQEFVEDVCEKYDWELRIIQPEKTLVEFAKEYGFPKEAAHSWIYRYLKNNPLAKFVTSLRTEKPHFYTGVRKDESKRRMETVTTESELSGKERWWWESPIAEWTEADCEAYIDEHDLPRNPVVETIGRSGECFCGAFSDRVSELLVLKENYPKQYQWLMELEDEVQAEIGSDEGYCYWGSSGETCQQMAEIDGEDDVVMELCADCERGGHRHLDG